MSKNTCAEHELCQLFPLAECSWCSSLGRLTLTVDDDVEVCTVLEFISRFWDKSRPCFVRFLRIVNDPNLAVEKDFMPPKYVDVTLDGATAAQSHCFLRGSEVEFAPKISKHRKRPPKQPPDERPLFIRKIPRRDQQHRGVDQGEQHEGRIEEEDNIDNDKDAGLGDDSDDCDYNDPEQYNAILEQFCEVDEQDLDNDNEEDDQNLMGILDEFLQDLESDLKDEGTGEDGPENVDMASREPVSGPSHPSEVPEAERLHQSQPLLQEQLDSVDPPLPSPSDPPPPPPSALPQKRKRNLGKTDEAEGAASSGSRAAPPATLAAAGAKSASLFDDSTIFVGPFTIVKRHHPVACSLGCRFVFGLT